MSGTEMQRYASIDGSYRYWLERRWGAFSPWLSIVMLNPSTADAEQDDPTIRRCIRFAAREGFANLHVFNLFAYRATDPGDLADAAKRGTDVVGVGNSALLESVLCTIFPVVVAWGAQPIAQAEAAKFVARAESLDKELVCLGVTKSGAPRHPLYVKSDAPLTPYRIAG